MTLNMASDAESTWKSSQDQRTPKATRPATRPPSARRRELAAAVQQPELAPLEACLVEDQEEDLHARKKERGERRSGAREGGVWF